MGRLTWSNRSLVRNCGVLERIIKLLFDKNNREVKKIIDSKVGG